MEENMRHWLKLCAPPQWAIKPIQAGRLKGKSDINPMWRMMAMTEVFGPCGEGWKYTIDKLWMERGAVVKSREGNVEREEVAAFALVSVYYKTGEHWSEPVPGIGGSMFTEMEKAGPFNSDEAYKMAITDALSVAFKAIGVAANIYSGERFDGSKYHREQRQAQQGQGQAPPVEISKAQKELLNELSEALHGNRDEMADALRTYSKFMGKDQGGNEVERYLKLADLEKPNDNEKFQRWVGKALGELRKDRK